jgi:hypothetical protein
MRKFTVGGIVVILALLAVFLLPGMTGQAAAPKQVVEATEWLEGDWPNSTGTPRAAFPFFLRLPTLTPTNTPTVTKTPTPAPPTATRTGVPGKTNLEGRIVMQKGRYYTHVEWIWFHIQLYNPTGNTLPYTILGVNVWKCPIRILACDLGFHTSWPAAPDFILPGCWGPTGNTDWNRGPNYRCALNSSEGWHTDHIGDSSNIEIEAAGTYEVVFWACVSSWDSCHGNGGVPDWRQLGQTTFIADPAPASAQSAADPTPMPQTKCFMVADEQVGIYLKCDE